MKTFIKKIIGFIAPVILVVLFIPLIDSVVMKLNFMNSPSVLIMGDSHTETGIDDSFVENCRNISQSSETYLFTFHKLKKVMKEIKPKTIILGFSPHNLTFFHDEKNLGLNGNDRFLELYPRYFFSLDFQTISYIHSNSSSGILKVFPSILRDNIKALARLKNGYIGTFRSSFKSNLDIELINEKIQTHFYSYEGKLHNISKTQLYYLEEIFQLCEESGIHLVLINLPVHEYYEKQVPQMMREYYYDLVESYRARNVTVFDYSNLKYPDKYYGDGDHLNALGAKVLTNKLKHSMEASYLLN